MTKAEIANTVARKTGMSRKDSIEAVEMFLQCVKGALKEGEKVSLVGFGTFYVKQKDARQGRNPRTGETMVVPVTRVVRVRVAQAVKRRVKEEALLTGSGLYVGTANDDWMVGVRDRLGEVGYELATGPTFEEALAAANNKPQHLSFVMAGPSLDNAAYATMARELKLNPKTSMLPIVLGRPEGTDLSKPATVMVVPG